MVGLATAFPRKLLIFKTLLHPSYIPFQRRKSWKTAFLGSQHFFFITSAAQFVDSITPASTRRYP